MPTDEQRALWTAIRAHPLDDAPRLVYADWLQEHGDEPRAEFIRVQCALAKLSTDRRKHRKERPRLEASEKELFATHGEEWLSGFRAVIDGMAGYQLREWLQRQTGRGPFDRGFIRIGGVTLDQAQVLSEFDASLEPVDLGHVWANSYGYREASLVALAQWIGSNSVLHLDISGATNDSLGAITRYGHFRFLSHLELHSSISDSGVRELARWPLATSLRVVNLQDNPITHAGAYVLADAPYFDDLVSLDLTHTRINADGRQRLRERFGHRVLLDAEP